MSKIYDNNLKQLEKINSEYTKLLMSDSDEEHEFCVKSQVFEDRRVWYVEYPDKVMQLDSLYDSEAVNEMWANAALKKLKFRTVIHVFGIGNISFIRKLIERTNDDNRIIIYEPDFTIMREIMEVEDITDILSNKRCILLMGNCLDDSIRNVYERYLDYSDCFNYIMIISLNYNTIFNKEYNEYTKGIEMSISTVASNFKFYSNAGKHANRNIFKNMKYFLESKSLCDFYRQVDKEIPAIVVAAGPSLNKNIKYLKEAKGKAIIICIDAAMRALAREGITPDLCVTVDFNKELGHFDEGDSDRVPMICSLISTASFVKQSKAVKLFYREDTPYINDFMDSERIGITSLPTGGTVANNALSAAIYMGCKNIIMIGQDLAYTNNQTHAAGTVKGDSMTVDEVRNLVFVEDLEGNKLQTCGEFVLYKQWIEETVATRSEVNFINATEGGAGIKGCEHITLKEAIDRYCKKEVDVKELIDKSKNLFTDEKRDRFLEYVNSIPDALKKVEKDASSGADCYRKMLKMVENNDYESVSFSKQYKKAKSLSNKIDKSHIAPMVFNEIQHQMNETLQTIYTTEEADAKSELIAACRQGMDSLERIEKASHEFAEYVIEQLKEYQ